MKQVLIDVSIQESALGRLCQRPDVRVLVADPISEEALVRPVEILRDTEILFCSEPPANLEEMRALQWIQLCSSGYEQLLRWNLPRRGVRASNALGVFDVPIAEWCVAMLVNLARDVRGMLRHQEQGIWDRHARFQCEVRGRIVGLWGYGGLARETARLCRNMGLRIHVLTRRGITPRPDIYRVPETGDPDGLLPHQVFLAGQEHAFLQGLDFLILATPLNASTRGMVGEAELRALPSHAFLLNPARGPLVQEAALLRALREGWIAGAALDTHYQYPLPPEHPLWHLPNVILTPHISGSSLSPRFQPRVWDIFGQNLDRYLAGQPLLNQIHPTQLQPT